MRRTSVGSLLSAFAGTLDTLGHVVNGVPVDTYQSVGPRKEDDVERGQRHT